MGMLDWLLGDDPEATGAAQASQAMAPAVTSHFQGIAQDWADWARQQEAMRARLAGQPLAQQALDPEALNQAMNVAMGAGPGAMIGKGSAGPLFDLSRLTERPDVPQVPIAREPAPAKGVPDWAADQLRDPARVEQYKQILQLGRNLAGDQNALGWWNTMPLRERFVGEFGEEAGDKAWRSAMNMWSATSPRSAFPENVKQASYFSNLLAEGQPLPELVKKYQKGDSGPYNLVPTTSAPPGYKNFPQHIVNIQNLLEPGGTLSNAYPLSNPKPASMAQNLVGNWSIPTIDVRDLRAMGMTTKGGKPMESVDPVSLYGTIESAFHQPLARELGLDPAQMQSSTWVGTPAYFNRPDMSGTSSALGTLEESIRRTAAKLGLTPEETLRRGFMRREFPLLSAGPLGLLLGQGIDADSGAALQ